MEAPPFKLVAPEAERVPVIETSPPVGATVKSPPELVVKEV